MRAVLTHLRRTLLSSVALAALAMPVGAALVPAAASAASNPKTALLNAESVTTDDGITKDEQPISLEQYAAENAGFTVTVVEGSAWKTMTAEAFSKYQLLIIGDPICNATALSAVESASTWTPVVMGAAGFGTTAGNRTVVGTDPEYHYLHGAGGAQPTQAGNPSSAGAEHLVQDGIGFAGEVEGATGLYFDTSCRDVELTPEEKEAEESEQEAAGAGVRSSARPFAILPQPILEGPDGRDKNDILEHLTVAPHRDAWTENVEPPCGGSVQQVAANPAFDGGETKLSDEDIEGWECSDHITFPSFPSDWFPLAVATDTETKPTCGTDPETAKTACGQAYVLIAGQGIVANSPNLSLTPPTNSTEAGATHTHTVTANVHTEEKPKAGVVVTFTVTGQNSGASGTCTTGAGAADPECKTDQGGDVDFTYSDTNLAGSDNIIATAAIELTYEEEVAPPVDDGARPAVEFKTVTITPTETANVEQTWTPLPVAPSPAAPAAKSAVLGFGSAHLAGTGRACVASTGYLASVSGKEIASVTYVLDGRKVKTLTHSTHGVFALRLHISTGRTHHLTIKVDYLAASKTRPTTIHKALARCAAVKRISTPRFTG